MTIQAAPLLDLVLACDLKEQLNSLPKVFSRFLDRVSLAC